MLRSSIFLVLISCAAVSPITAADSRFFVRIDGYKIVHVYPHDPEAFTQGLVYIDGHLYESTGLYGKSSIRMVDLSTGQVLQRYNLPAEYFSEGLTTWGSNLVQLTWKSETGFVYDRFSFELRRTFHYKGEGWGLTRDQSDSPLDGFYSAPLHLLPDQLLHSAQDVIFRQPGGIEDHCVTRRDQRRTGPGAVTLIARTQLGGHVGRNVRNRTAPYFLLIKPPLLPYDRIGVEENLEIGVRKNFGPNVTPFHHYTAAGSHFSLAGHHQRAHLGMYRNPRCRLRHVPLADAGRNIAPIEQHPIPSHARLELDARVLRRLK